MRFGAEISFFYDFPLILKVFINIHEYIYKLDNIHLQPLDERHVSKF